MRKPQDLNNLFNDLFRLNKDHPAPDVMKNPYNIEWILRDFPEKHKEYSPYINQAIESNQYFIVRDPDLRAILTDSNNIAKRMRDLVASGLDIKNSTCTVVKFRKLDLLKVALELGADINAKTSQDNTPLRLAMMFGKKDLLEHIWTHPQLDKALRDESGFSFAINAVLYKHTDICEYFFEHNREEFLVRSHNNSNVLHLMGSVRKDKENKKFEEKLLDYLYDNHREMFYEKSTKHSLNTPMDNANMCYEAYFIEKRYREISQILQDKPETKAHKI